MLHPEEPNRQLSRGGDEAIAATKRAGANIHRAADFILGQLREAAGDGGLTTSEVAA